MRYIYKKIEPKHGDTRIISKFLWFPVTIGDETRRWEHATILQKFERCYGPRIFSGAWYNKKFIDNITLERSDDV